MEMAVLPVSSQADPREFEEWLRVPIPHQCADARLIVRRALPAEFDAIYDLVDEAFVRKSPRSVYDWIYRRNPSGVARCTVVVEKASGRIVSSEARWPWPVARGAEPASGYLSGDFVAAIQWQRRGLSELRLAFRSKNPWRNRSIGLSWPNEKSRATARKHGRPGPLGALARGVLPLRGQALARQGWPRALASAAGLSAAAALRAREVLLRPGLRGVAIDAVRRFDSAFDEVTARCMSWPGYWCPHHSEFLNWRYFEHPAHHHVALALSTARSRVGYCVVRIGAQRAWLMELAAPGEPRAATAALLLRAARAAREAGCASLEFSAPPRWRHWPLLRSVGFVDRPSDLFLFTRGPSPDVRDLDLWQCVPGDVDAL
jgi:hypothetical protein